MMYKILLNSKHVVIPESSILRMERRDNACLLIQTDNSEVDIHPNDWDEIVHQSVSQTIPAQPDTFILDYFKDEEGEFVTKNQIVGWGLRGGDQAVPITMRSDLVEAEDYAVLFPDGHVEGLNGEIWESELTWLDSMRSRHDQHRK